MKTKKTQEPGMPVVQVSPSAWELSPWGNLSHRLNIWVPEGLLVLSLRVWRLNHEPGVPMSKGQLQKREPINISSVFFVVSGYSIGFTVPAHICWRSCLFCLLTQILISSRNIPTDTLRNDLLPVSVLLNSNWHIKLTNRDRYYQLVSLLPILSACFS
jgi:hypothetical protein